MSGEFMSTKEVAKYININEKQIYLLVKSGRIPCTRVTGKWIFPKNAIDDWIQNSVKGGLQKARKKVSKMEGALLASGGDRIANGAGGLHSEF